MDPDKGLFRVPRTKAREPILEILKLMKLALILWRWKRTRPFHNFFIGNFNHFSMNNFLFFLFLFFPFTILGQTNKHYQKDNSNFDFKPNVVHKGFSQPSFPGGDSAFKIYVIKQLDSVKENTRACNGLVVYWNFMVTKYGTIRDVKLGEISPKPNNCVLISKKIIENMPKWVPARRYNKSLKRYVAIDWQTSEMIEF